MLEHLATSYGYPLLLVGTFLEGETILLFAGFAAHQGYLKLWLVIVTAFAGSLAGDQLYFAIGRRKGRLLLERHASWRVKAAKVLTLLDRHATLIMLVFRFMYGFRTITPLVIGTSGIGPYRFLLLNAAGAILWSTTIAFAGFLFGAAAENILKEARRIEEWIALGILGAGAAVWIIYLVKRFLRLKKE